MQSDLTPQTGLNSHASPAEAGFEDAGEPQSPGARRGRSQRDRPKPGTTGGRRAYPTYPPEDGTDVRASPAGAGHPGPKPGWGQKALPRRATAGGPKRTNALRTGLNSHTSPAEAGNQRRASGISDIPP